MRFLKTWSGFRTEMVVSLSSSPGCLGILMIEADWSVASLRNRLSHENLGCWVGKCPLHLQPWASRGWRKVIEVRFTCANE